MNFGNVYIEIPLFINTEKLSTEIKDFFENKLHYTNDKTIIVENPENPLTMFNGFGLFVCKVGERIERFILHPDGFVMRYTVRINTVDHSTRMVVYGFRNHIEQEREIVKKILTFPYFKKNPFSGVLTVTNNPFRPLTVAKIPTELYA